MYTNVRINLNKTGIKELKKLNLKFKEDKEDDSLYYTETDDRTVRKFLDINNCYVNQKGIIKYNDLLMDDYVLGFIEGVKESEMFKVHRNLNKYGWKK